MLAVLLAAEPAEEVNPVALDVPNIIWGGIFFLIFLVLMYSVCLPPIRKAMRQRAEQQQLDDEAAERAVVEGEHIRRDYEATLAAARAEAARIVDEARAEAEAERSRRLAEVDAELVAQRQELMTQLEAQRAEALAAVTSEVAELASVAASRVIQRPVDPAAQRKVVDEFVAAATRTDRSES